MKRRLSRKRVNVRRRDRYFHRVTVPRVLDPMMTEALRDVFRSSVLTDLLARK